MARVVIAVALAVGAIALWIALRGDDTPPPAKSATAQPDQPLPPPPPIAAPDAAPFAHHDPAPAAPVLPNIVDAGVLPPQSIQQQFAAEPRDAGWAPPPETELHKRVDALRVVHTEATDCRTSTCKLVIAGTQAAMVSAIDALQTDKGGLRGWAERWILSAPEMHGDQMTLVAYIHFDRVPHVQGPDDD